MVDDVLRLLSGRERGGGAQKGANPILVLASGDSQSWLEAEQIAGLRSALPPGTEINIDYLGVLKILGSQQGRRGGGWGMLDVEEHVRALTAEDIVIYANFLADVSGGAYLSHRLVPKLARESKAPVFTIEGDAIGDGAIGGNVVDGRRMGKIAVRRWGGFWPGKRPGPFRPRRFRAIGCSTRRN